MLAATQSYEYDPHGRAHCGRDYRPVVLAFSVMLLVALILGLTPSSAHGLHATESLAEPLECYHCHKSHVPAIGTGLLDVGDPAASISNQTDVCLFCHEVDATGSTKKISDINIGTGTTFPSGHAVESATTELDLTNECSSCHSPHTDTTGLPRPELNGYTVDTATHPNTWCRACHDPDSDSTPGDLTKPDVNWSGVTGTDYYDQIFTSRLPDTYIGAGTFRGWTAYETNSAHSSIPASDTAGLAKGDCLWCHERHSSASTYDNLKGDFGPSTPTDINADACFASGCHDDYATMGYGSGHFITDAAGASPMDPHAPLPCYECHNAHGSKNGNTKLIQDSLGAGLDPSTKAGESAFCYTCHLSSDGYGWNSTTTGMELWTTLASESGITTSVAGIPREDMLVLPPTVPQHAYDNLAGCGCHGSVHAPNPEGVSNGGQTCYDCHSGLESSMEYSFASGVYGHIVGRDGRPGDTAAYPDYDTDTKDKIYCLSCHVDHTFNTDRGKNLRTHVADGGGVSVAQRTDFVYSADGNSANDGICLSCHSAAIPTTDTTYAVSGPNYAGKAHDYVVNDASIVGYGVSPDPTSAFQPNCTKCHSDTDGLDGPRQDGTWKIAAHFSSNENRIAQALGAAVVATTSDSTEENLCFACHDGAYVTGNTGTALDADGYGVKPPSGGMSDESQAVKTLVGMTYAHNVVTSKDEHASDETAFDANNKHIECEDCHNPHVLGNNTVGSSNHSQGVNTIAAGSPIDGVSGWTWALGSATEWSTTGMSMVWSTDVPTEYGICLKCHSFKNTGLTSWNATWSDVALEFNTKNDSYHPVFGALPNDTTDTGDNDGSSRLPYANRVGNQWTQGLGRTMYCSDCHGQSGTTPAAMGPHGSAIPRLLVGYWPKAPGPDGVPGNADDVYYNLAQVNAGTATGMLCLKCHPMPLSNTLSSGNAVHNNHLSTARSNTCVDCHLVRIHGGKMSRLLGDTGASAADKARYMDATQIALQRYRKVGTGTPGSKDYCLAACGGVHGGAQVNEDW